MEARVDNAEQLAHEDVRYTLERGPVRLLGCNRLRVVMQAAKLLREKSAERTGRERRGAD